MGMSIDSLISSSTVILVCIGACTLIGIASLSRDIRRQHRQQSDGHLCDWDLITADVQKLTPEEWVERGLEPQKVLWK
jgi:hypothetical protein